MRASPDLPANRFRSRAARAGLVFAVALLVRLLFLFSTEDRAWPHSALYEGDAPVWVRWAQALARGETFEHGVPMRTPGIAYLLRALPGGEAAPFVGLKVLWCALSAATCAALFALVERHRSSAEAWIAAALACFSFGAYELATSLNGEAPYALLLVLAIGGTLALAQAPRPSFALAAALGVLHGAALLVRAEHALILAAFLAWGVLARRSARSLAAAALVLVAALLACLPWTLKSRAAVERFNTVEAAPVDFATARPPWTPEAQAFLRALPAFAREGNFRYLQWLAGRSGREAIDRADVERYFASHFDYVPEPLGEWTLVSSKGPLDFALANHPASAGGFSRAALLDGKDVAPEFAFGRPSHLKLYQHGYAVGWERIRAAPGKWAALVARKLERFAAGATLGITAANLPWGRDLRRWPVDLATPLEPSRAWTAVLLLALVAGAALVARTSLGALCLCVLGAKLAVTVAFYGYARQAASIGPVLCVFLAALLAWLLARALDRVRRGDPQRPPRQRAVAAAGIVLVAALLAVDVSRALGANDYDVGPAIPGHRIPAAPEWGPSAFETVDELRIRPR